MQIGSNMAVAVVLVLVSICAVFDIRKKEIPLYIVIIGIVTGLGNGSWQIWNGTISIMEIGLALLPGCFFLLIAILTKEKVGYGDGMLLLVLGLFAGFDRCMFSLCISLFFTSVCALILLCVRKVGRNSSLPFVPFLVAGMGVGFFV